MNKLLLRPAEAAEALGVSRSRLYAMLAEGQLPVIHIGRTMRVPARELERWISDKLSGTAAAASAVEGADGNA